uniref:Uncharacterized protein n=1 Tax=Anguilla anguilla TaxID=7936 RepID=A0A0E9QTP1_ANGAN
MQFFSMITHDQHTFKELSSPSLPCILCLKAYDVFI